MEPANQEPRAGDLRCVSRVSGSPLTCSTCPFSLLLFHLKCGTSKGSTSVFRVLAYLAAVARFDPAYARHHYSTLPLRILIKICKLSIVEKKKKNLVKDRFLLFLKIDRSKNRDAELDVTKKYKVTLNNIYFRNFFNFAHH